MALSTIQLDQAGIPAGVPGSSRSDGLIGTTVFPTDPANGAGVYLWELIARPVGSSTTLTGATTATPSFTPDMAGSYLVQLTFNGVLTSGTLDAIGQFISTQGRFGIRLPNGTLIPAAGETSQADSESGLSEGWHPERASSLVAVDHMMGGLGTTHGSVLFVGTTGNYAAAVPGGPDQVLVSAGPGSDPVWTNLSSIAAPPGSGTAGAVTLTDAYTAGSTLVTTTPLGAVKLQRGSAADTNNVLEILNGAGAITSTIDGNGNHFSSLYYVDAAKTSGISKGPGFRVNTVVSNVTRLSVISGQVQLTDAGTEGTPVLVLNLDLDTGAWAPASDTYALSTGGIEAMRLTSTQDMIVTSDITSGGQVFAPAGTGAAPGLAFTGDTGYGLTKVGSTTYMVAFGQAIIGASVASVLVNKNMTIAGSVNASAADTWNIGSTSTYYASVNTKHLTLHEQATSPGPLTSVGYLWTKTAVPNTLWFTDDSGAEWQLSGLGADGGTLDASYDYAGAGAGRVITADAGAVSITNPNVDAANVLELTTTALATGAALSITNTGDGAAISVYDGTSVVMDINPDGSILSPLYYLDTARSLGIAKGAGHTVTLFTNSLPRLNVTPGNTRVVAVGSEISPALGVGDSLLSGLWEPTPESLALSTNSVEAMRWSTSQHTIIPQTSRFVLDDDEDTYLTANGADDNIDFVTGGSTRFTIATSIVSCLPAFSVKQGTVTAPGLRNNGDADTGLYFPMVGGMGATAGGVLRQMWTSNGTGDPVSTIYRTAINSEQPSTNLDNVGLALTNPTAATDIQNQNSPALLWEGATKPAEAASEVARWSAQLVATSAGANWGSTWVLSSEDDGGWNTMLSFVSDGDAYFEASILPGAPGSSPLGASYDLGSAAIPWRHLYVEDNIVHESGGLLGFYGQTPAAQSSAYTLDATVVIARTLEESAAATIVNNNNVLAAVITDLQNIGLLG